ncbi:MAG: autotransporter-associated beta strand repeat-containing protein, partial [Kiritimatiellia bacterium]
MKFIRCPRVYLPHLLAGLMVCAHGYTRAAVISIPDALDQSGVYTVNTPVDAISGEDSVYVVGTMTFDAVDATESFDVTEINIGGDDSAVQWGHKFNSSSYGFFIPGSQTILDSIQPGDSFLSVFKINQTTGDIVFYLDPDLYSPEASNTPALTRSSSLTGSITAIQFRGGNSAATSIVDYTGYAIYTGTNSPFDQVGVDCSSPPSLTLGAIPEAGAGASSAELAYSNPVNEPDQYEITYSSLAQSSGLFTNQPLTALPSSPIPLTLDPSALPGSYTGTLTVSRSSDGCYTTHDFTVTLTGAVVVTWLGTTSDDIEDPANWSSNPDLPTIDDLLLFDTAANSAINPPDGSTVTGGMYRFTSKNWTLDDANIVVGSSITVEENRTVVLYRYNGAGNVVTEGRDITFDVGAGGGLNIQGFDTNYGHFAVTKNGEGSMFIAAGSNGAGAGGAPNNAVHTWYINGGTVTVRDDVTNAYVLANGGEIRFTEYKSCNPVVSGNGTVRVLGPAKAVSSNARFSHTGDIVIDNSGLRLSNFSSVDLSGHDGSFVMSGSSGIALAGDLTVSALDGDATSLFRGAYPGGRVLTVGAGGGDGSFAGVLRNENGETGYTMKLVKVGAGTQELSGINLYAGTTIISNGTLIVNGTHTGGGSYTVDAGATLGGTGSISSAVTVLGSINPGVSSNSPGTLTINGDVTAAGTWSFFLGGPGSGDLLDIDGNFTRGGLIT